MSSNELNLQKENIESFKIENEIKNNNKDKNLNQKELSQIFNNLYDSNFLIIINELSSQIQFFYKSSIIHYNIINSFLSKNENKDIPNFSNIKNSFNNIETLFLQFYFTAKILFKKMKVYRSEKIKNIRYYSLNNNHKKQTIAFNKDKKNIPLLNFENIKDNNNNLISINNGEDGARSSRTDKIIYLDNSNESNINSNNNFSQSCNTTIDKESNILIIEDKNQHSITSMEFLNNLKKELKTLEETISVITKDNNDSKINNMANSINNLYKLIKDNLINDNLGNEITEKKIINNLNNKINVLNEENNKIKKLFEKYKNEEKIKRKFFEDQIFILSNKNNENEKIKKNDSNKIKEMKNKMEEINNINNNFKNINKDLKDKLKIKDEKINELQDIINKKIKDNNKQLINNINNNKLEYIYNNGEQNSLNNNLDDYVKKNINPENFSIIKVYQMTNKLKWILLKKNIKHVINYNNFYENKLSQNIDNKQARTINNNSKIINKEIDVYNYNDFIWLPYKEEKYFSEFGDISLFIEKEKDYDNIIIRLNQKIKIYENEIDKLKIENYNLNSIMKHKAEEKNLLGISFIEEDPESSRFIDDKGCEDILTGLDRNKKGGIYNIKLKNNIDLFMKNISFSDKDLSLFSTIIKQMGCSDEDIIKLLGDKNVEI